MGKLDHIQTSFAGGEIGPSLFGRTDIAAYANACETVNNFLVRPSGSLISAPGTRYVGEVKTSANKTRLIQFIFNRTDAYIIEMGASYFRFYTDDGVVLSTGTTNIYEVAHTFTQSEIFDVQFCQLNDVIWMVHKDHAPQKLTRYDSDDWEIEDFAFIGGPFLDDNTDAAITIQASGSSGTVNLTLNSTASTSFVASSGSTRGHINSYWKIGDVLTDSTTGLEVQGYVKIATVTSPSTATAAVQKTLSTINPTVSWAEGAWNDVNGWPSSVTFHESRLFMARTDMQPQNVWASKPFVYDDFLTGAMDDDGLNLQLVSNEANEIKWIISGKSLVAGTYGGEFTISSGETASPLTPNNVVASKETSWGSEPIVPKKIGTFFYYVQRFRKKLRELFYNWDLDSYKSVDKTILSPHISKDGFIDMTYQQNPDTMLWMITTNGTLAVLTREIDQEMQAWSTHDTDGLYESIATIPHPTKPYDQVWVVVKRTITPTGGSATTKRYLEVFEDMEVPARQDECWYIHSGLSYDAYDATLTTATPATISLSATAGSTVVVTSNTAYFSADDIGQRIRSIDVDGNTTGELEITNYTSSTVVAGVVSYTFTSSTVASGSWGLSVTNISGMDHLEAKTVVVLADGGTDKPNKVVSNGTITLAYNYFVVTIGLPYSQTVKTLPIEGGNPQGTAQGKIQKINQIGLKVNRSHKGFKVGGTADLAERINFRDPTTDMGTPEQLFTGVLPGITFRDDYRYGAQVVIVNEDPLPVEILSIMADLTTNA